VTRWRDAPFDKLSVTLCWRFAGAALGVELAGMQLAENLLTVCAVMVEVAKPGTAYAHDSRGQCLAFTGTRENLIRLFHLLRAYLKGENPVVTVSRDDWEDVHAIERSDCPNHMLPAIKGEISYYAPY